jgi:hypothetical protein
MPPPSRRPPAVNPIADPFRNAGALGKEMIETDEPVEVVRAFEQHASGSQLSSTGGASAYLPYTAGMVSSHPQCHDVGAEDPRMQHAIGESLESPPPSPRTSESATFTQPTIMIFGAKSPPPLPPKARSAKSKSSPAAPPPPPQASFFLPRG